MNRLSPDTLGQLPASVRIPKYDRRQLSCGLVHLGVGAFYRAHQGVYTEDAIETSGGDWGTVGISLRSPTAQSQLAPQGGLYSVGSCEADEQSLRVIGNLKRVLTAPDNPAAALDHLADPAIKAVTLTITEKGYALDPSTGALLTDNEDIAADIRSPQTPRSAIGYLVEGLRRRMKSGHQPFTVISCDNLPSNGQRTRSAVLQFAELTDSELARWIEAEAAFPETMVDRIVPATTKEDLDLARTALGVDDKAFVKTEPFRQWVIEDNFCNDRPRWEKAGALIVPAVAPYETVKLRLLNGPHSAIAYLGYLAGYATVDKVVQDEAFASFISQLMTVEIAPTLKPPKRLDLSDYIAQLQNRFSNPALQHKTWQIAADGSQKLPQRLLNTIRDRLRSDQPFDRLALAVAGWIRYAAGRSETGERIDVRDPMSARFDDLLDNCDPSDPASITAAFLKLSSVFGDDLPDDPVFRRSLDTQAKYLWTLGARKAVGQLSAI